MARIPEIDHAPEVAMSRFKMALGRALSVSKPELLRMEEAEKRANAGKPKRGPKPKSSASARASRDTD